VHVTTHAARPGRPFIGRYGGGAFHVGDFVQTGPILVLPDRALAWSAPALAALGESDFEAVFAAGAAVELILLGCGRRLVPPAPALRAALKRRRLALEPMDTGAACRTFNVLLAEDRRVAAALYPV
jgi:uncharacterized protein